MAGRIIHFAGVLPDERYPFYTLLLLGREALTAFRFPYA
jgi:hypothetical protein